MSRFVWFEAYVDDLAAARGLLAVVPGWTFAAPDGPVATLTVACDSVPVAALFAIPADVEAEPHWVAHLAVDDVAAVCGRAAFVGGTVLVPPSDVEGVGTTALVEDPAGAVIAPCSFTGAAPTRGTGPGSLAPATLLAPRKAQGGRVYRTLLDWREGASVDTDAGRLTLLTAGGAPVGALLDAGEVAGPQWVPHVVVADPDAVLAAIEAAGGHVLLPPTAVDGVGTVALAVLADGLPLGLLRP